MRYVLCKLYQKMKQFHMHQGTSLLLLASHSDAHVHNSHTHTCTHQRTHRILHPAHACSRFYSWGCLCLQPSWQAALSSQFSMPYFTSLEENLRQESAAGHKVFPPRPLVFEALNQCPLQVSSILKGTSAHVRTYTRVHSQHTSNTQISLYTYITAIERSFPD